MIDGWPADAGTAPYIRTSLRTTSTKDGEIEWLRIETPLMRLYNNAHMYLIQGMPIAHLLLSMSLSRGEHALPGPLLYVTGHPSSIWQVPFHYRGLILGRALRAPEKMTVSELLLALFNDEMKHLQA